MGSAPPHPPKPSRGRSRFRRRLRPLLLLMFSALFLVAMSQGARALWIVAAADIDSRGTGPVFLDRFGERIISRPADLQTYRPLEDISPHVPQAVIAMEDVRFWRHPGVDPIGIARAALSYWRSDAMLQGASTITQQLAKNLFLTPERTFSRKLREAFLALALEMRYSKKQLLELYLNRVYFGSGAYGIEAAARLYFNKGADALDLGEAALLAGLLPAPNRYSPFRDADIARQRRRLVLERMARLGVITQEEAERYAAAPLNVRPPRRDPNGYFTDYVTEKLVEQLGPHLTFHGGLEVMTTLHPDVQAAAGRALAQSGLQGAVVVMDTRSGDILALVGGRDYGESQFNRAVHAYRQPGSAFKPIVFAAALERHWRPNALLDDEPRSYGTYQPTNWGQRYHGRVTMNYALAHSLNAASVWLLRQIGPRAAMDMASRLGIRSLTGDDMHLALALGGLRHGVTPLDLAQAYTAFATGGVLRKGRTILHVRDKDGREWPVSESPAPAPKVLSPQVAYIITHMLQQAMEEGTGTAARLGVPAAGKTGSTNGNRDAWFVGYTPHYLGVVFIGHDDNRPLPGGGGEVAAPVWRAAMAPLVNPARAAAFPVPRGVTPPMLIDVHTGLRAGSGCDQVMTAVFIQGTEPEGWAPCAFAQDPESTEEEDASMEAPRRRRGDGGEEEPQRDKDDASEDRGHREEDTENDGGAGLLFLRRLLRPEGGASAPPRPRAQTDVASKEPPSPSSDMPEESTTRESSAFERWDGSKALPKP